MMTLATPAPMAARIAAIITIDFFMFILLFISLSYIHFSAYCYFLKISSLTDSTIHANIYKQMNV